MDAKASTMEVYCSAARATQAAAARASCPHRSAVRRVAGARIRALAARPPRVPVGRDPLHGSCLPARAGLATQMCEARGAPRLRGDEHAKCRPRDAAATPPPTADRGGGDRGWLVSTDGTSLVILHVTICQYFCADTYVFLLIFLQVSSHKYGVVGAHAAAAGRCHLAGRMGGRTPMA
jgi:hypothetical protein